VLADPPPAAVDAVGDPYVVVHPGASVQARAWPVERHRELVAALTARGERVVVTGSPDETTLTAAVCAGMPALDLGGRTTLAELAGVLAGARAVVVGNTGPAHLAAAVGTPVVSLFARTVPARRWRPWGPHVLLTVDVPCAGCRARSCPVPHHPCMRRLGVDDALAALAALPSAPLPTLEVAS
jgi:ADP-heptose:LPS heptosyltransferase